MGEETPLWAATVHARIQAEVDAHGGIRPLARRLAECDGFSVEVWRRSLNRYLHEGRLPSRAKAEAMAGCLGRSADWFAAPVEVRRVGGIAGVAERLEQLGRDLAVLREGQDELRVRVARLEGHGSPSRRSRANG